MGLLELYLSKISPISFYAFKKWIKNFRTHLSIVEYKRVKYLLWYNCTCSTLLEIELKYFPMRSNPMWKQRMDKFLCNINFIMNCFNFTQYNFKERIKWWVSFYSKWAKELHIRIVFKNDYWLSPNYKTFITWMQIVL